MDKLRHTQQFVTPTILKMPSINEIHFPKMKSRLNLQQIKLYKNQKSSSLKQSDESSQGGDKLVRSYSMSLMTIKKDLKSMYSPKKKRLNFNPENVICIKGQKGQNFGVVSKNSQSIKLSICPPSPLQDPKHASSQINLQTNLTQGGGESPMRSSLYPGIKFQSAQYTQKRTKFLKKFLPGLQNVPHQPSLTSRLPKKKHLFNAKLLVAKKHKDQLPDQLITRKLVWDGKEMKKIDHNLIYRDIVEKFKNQKIQKQEGEEATGNEEDKVIQFMRLSAWEFHDQHKLGRDQQIKTSRN